MMADLVISKYRRHGSALRSVSAFVFFVIGVGSIIGIIYELFHPDFYVSSHKSRYIIIGVLAAIATIYISPNVVIQVMVSLKLLFGNDEALVLHEGQIVFGQFRRLVINPSQIGNVALEPRNAAFGRPERLKIMLNGGHIRYIRCDILDRPGTELLNEIAKLAHLPVSGRGTTPA